MVFQFRPDEQCWVAVTNYKKYFDVYSALNELESLQIASRSGSPERFRVIGFSSLSLAKECVNEADLIEEDGVYLWRPGGMKTPAPLDHPQPHANPSSPRTPSPVRDRGPVFAGVRNRKIDVKMFLVQNGCRVVDKRPKKGCLWVVGDTHELQELIIEIMQNTDARFRFTPTGGRATRHKAGWYTKYPQA